MASKKTIMVPAITDGFEKEKAFRENFAKLLAKGAPLALDFNAHPAVSSVVFGFIMYHVKDHYSRIEFVNVSNLVARELSAIMGTFAGRLIKGPVINLDIETSGS
jgi:hypothetical protein